VDVTRPLDVVTAELASLITDFSARRRRR
jgi:hypothetical protein